MTIEFSKVGERKIAEYIFSDYLKNEFAKEAERFDGTLWKLDPQQENFSEFVEQLKTMTATVGKRGLDEMIPLFIKENAFTPPSFKKEPTVLISEISESINDLQNDSVMKKLSGSGEWSTEVMSATKNVMGDRWGKQPNKLIPLLDDKTWNDMSEDEIAEELKDVNSIQNEIRSLAWEQIEIEESKSSITISADLIELKKDILRRRGASIIRPLPIQKVESKGLLYFKSVGDTNEGVLSKPDMEFTKPAFADEDIKGRVVGATDNAGDIDDSLNQMLRDVMWARQGPLSVRLRGKMYIQRFFINYFRNQISDIQAGVILKVTIGLRQSTTEKGKAEKAKFEAGQESALSVLDIKTEISTQEIKLTEANKLNIKGKGAVEEYKVTRPPRGEVAGTGSASSQPHLDLRNMPLKEQRKQKQEISSFFNSLVFHYENLLTSIQNLEGKVN